MNIMSIFSLNRFKEGGHGGANNYPAVKANNPQGGYTMLPIFGDVISKFGIAKGQIEAGGHAGWGFEGPTMTVPFDQGGTISYPLFATAINAFTKKVAGTKTATPKAEAGTKPEKPKAPKPLPERKGKSAHKKIHDNPHPILAECDRLTGNAPGSGKPPVAHYESMSSTMTPLVTVDAKTKQKESTFKIMSSRFKEGAKQTSDLPTKFRVVLLEEGLGNTHDAFYYTEAALESAVEVFNGLKIMADHPTEEEEDIRPERSTRDILGHYENLSVEEAEDGQHQLCADVDILPSVDCEWARARMVRAVENAEKFPGRDFIGLSINASGPSEQMDIEQAIEQAPEGAKQKLIDAQADGVDTVKMVSKINRAVSCDLVTEAGAGGKVLSIIEGDDNGKKTA
jgi:hypothetical protein